MKLFNIIPDRNATGYYRAILPGRHLYDSLTTSDKLEFLGWPGYVVHRLPKPTFLPVLEGEKAQGKKLVLNIDDDVLAVPEWNPAWPWATAQANVDAYKRGLELADLVLASTEPLRQALISQGVDGQKIKVAPNLIDLADWPDLPHPDGKLRILWAGSIHHEKDLDVLVPALERLIPEYEEHVQFLFWGDLPQQLAEPVRLKGSLLAKMVPASRFNGALGLIEGMEFDKFIPTLNGVVQPDIGLAPLCDEPFNYSKSNLKWLEYTMAGAVTVATDLPPYRCIKQGKTGVLVPPGDHEAWYNVIKLLIEDHKLRNELADNALDDVVKNWTWQNKAHVWRQALKLITE